MMCGPCINWGSNISNESDKKNIEEYESQVILDPMTWKQGALSCIADCWHTDDSQEDKRPGEESGS
jgi:hypothetical protein